MLKCSTTSLMNAYDAQATHVVIQGILTLAISSSSIFLMAPISFNMASIFAAVLVSVTFIAPAILVWAQKFKKCVISSSPVIP